MNTKILAACILYFLPVFCIPVKNQWKDEVSLKEIDSKHFNYTTSTSRWCGFHSNLNQRRYKRYALHGSRWKANPITYNIAKYPPVTTLLPHIVDEEIAEAFLMWEDVTNIKFIREKYGKVNIEISFESGNHSDDEPFDGPGRMTAHAYYPVYGGDIHFDADENWSVRSKTGINLFQVATHEIGHALGLDHSEDKGAVMSPFYVNYNENFKLHEDDIQGIQYLYGKKTSMCEHVRIDAAVAMVDKSVYLFRSDLVYKLNSHHNDTDPEYPKAIVSVFGNVEWPLDAAFTRPNGVSYFLKNDKIWRFTNMAMDDGFPKNMSEFFPNIPTPVDDAVVLPSDEKIYFIKGDQYWKFDHTKSPSVSLEYPKPLSDWKGIPANLDAALRLNNNEVYFFKGNEFWRFNDKIFSVYLAQPAYPKDISSVFPGCRKKRLHKYI